MKVFVDSSVVFKLVRQMIMWSDLSNSKLLSLTNYRFVISDYVVAEVIRNIYIKYNYSDKNIIERFMNISNFEFERFDNIYDGVGEYVYDLWDIKILSDCYFAKCDILLTDNMSDFDIDGIKKNYGIMVQNYL